MPVTRFWGVTGAWAAGLAKLSVLPDAGAFRAAALLAAGFFRISVLLAAGSFRAAALLAAGLFRMTVLLAAGFFRAAGLLAAGPFRIVCFLATGALLAAGSLALACALASLSARPLANASPRGLVPGSTGALARCRRGDVKGSLLETGSRIGTGLALGSSRARPCGLPEPPPQQTFPCPEPSVSPASSGGL